MYLASKKRKYFYFLPLLCLLASPAWAPPPTFDAATAGGVTNNATSKTFSHTAGTLTNGLAVICVTTQDASVVHDSVTYGGSAATQIGSTAVYATDKAVSAWYFKNPPSGASSIVADFGADNINSIITSAVTYANVNQTTPIGTVPAPVIDFDTANPSEARITVTSAVGELVVACVGFAAGTATPTTSQNNRAVTLDTGNHSHGQSDAAGAATVDMSWTLAESRSNAILGVSLKPSVERRAVAPILFQ